MKGFLTEVWMWLRAQTQDGEARGGQLWEAIATPHPPTPPEQGWPTFGLSRAQGFSGVWDFQC